MARSFLLVLVHVIIFNLDRLRTTTGNGSLATWLDRDFTGILVHLIIGISLIEVSIRKKSRLIIGISLIEVSIRKKSRLIIGLGRLCVHMLVSPSDKSLDILIGEVLIVFEASISHASANNREIIQTIADTATGLSLPRTCRNRSLHVLTGIHQLIP